jgi:hypothetical protein
MSKFVVSGAIAALAVAIAGSASAAVITTFKPSVATPEPGYTIIDSFNTTTGITGVQGVDYILSSVSTSTGAQPQTTPPPPVPYLSVLANGTVSINFSALTAGVVRAFEFDWGSVDTFNTLVIHSSAGDTVIVPPAPGNGSWTSSATNGLFNVSGTANETFSGITLMTSQNSFEIDNLAVAIPEPATWAMMIMGFGAIGFAMRRRTRMMPAAI